MEYFYKNIQIQRQAADLAATIRTPLVLPTPPANIFARLDGLDDLEVESVMNLHLDNLRLQLIHHHERDDLKKYQLPDHLGSIMEAFIEDEDGPLPSLSAISEDMTIDGQQWDELVAVDEEQYLGDDENGGEEAEEDFQCDGWGFEDSESPNSQCQLHFSPDTLATLPSEPPITNDVNEGDDEDTDEHYSQDDDFVSDFGSYESDSDYMRLPFSPSGEPLDDAGELSDDSVEPFSQLIDSMDFDDPTLPPLETVGCDSQYVSLIPELTLPPLDSRSTSLSSPSLQSPSPQRFVSHSRPASLAPLLQAQQPRPLTPQPSPVRQLSTMTALNPNQL